MELSHLPDEMALLFIDRLSPYDVCNLSSTSKYWLEICRDESYWRRIHRERFPYVRFNENESAFNNVILEIKTPTLTTPKLVTEYIHNIFTIHLLWQRLWGGDFKPEDRDIIVNERIDALLLFLIRHRGGDSKRSLMDDVCKNIRIVNVETFAILWYEFKREFINFNVPRLSDYRETDDLMSDALEKLFMNNMMFASESGDYIFVEENRTDGYNLYRMQLVEHNNYFCSRYIAHKRTKFIHLHEPIPDSSSEDFSDED